MGHAGAIVGGAGQGNAKSKMAYLKSQGIAVANGFPELGTLMLEQFKERGIKY